MGTGLLSPAHLAVVLAIALIVFGPKRLPELGRALGHGMRSFKEAIGGESDDDDYPEAPPVPASTPQVAAEVKPAVAGSEPAVVVPESAQPHPVATEDPPVRGSEPAVVVPESAQPQPVATEEPPVAARPPAEAPEDPTVALVADPAPRAEPGAPAAATPPEQPGAAER